MEANELRIGNYVYLTADGHEDEPDLVKWDIIDYEYYTDKMDYIQPIPLTEEILLKCGFEVEKYIATGDFYLCGKKVISINRRSYKIIISADDYSNWNFLVDSNYLYKDISREIKQNILPFQYLHQLQNLYFALTNQELEVKL